MFADVIGASGGDADVDGGRDSSAEG